MKIQLVVPDVKPVPLGRPRACAHCGSAILQRHGRVAKPINDHLLRQVEAHRYKCTSCQRTFRHYPHGVTTKTQSQRLFVLAVLIYGLGLSCAAAAHLLRALGAPIGQMTVWRDVQQAGAALRRTRPAGRVRVLGADETGYRVKGRKVVVGFVVDGERGHTLGFEVLVEGDGEAFRRWLAPYVQAYGVEVLVSDDNAAYAGAAQALGLRHQVCITHVRKYVAKRATSILEQARAAWGEGAQLTKLTRDLERTRELLDALELGGASQLEQLHRSYLWAEPPRQKGAKASAGYRMRMLTLELWEKWRNLRLHLAHPEFRMDGTNTCSERSIGKRKVWYKTMRGFKSSDGMSNSIALTQWLYSGAPEHNLAAAVAA